MPSSNRDRHEARQEAARVSPAPAIACRGVRAGFGEKTILHGLTFDIASRGIVALLGPAGVGKSTLLRTLARYNELIPSFWTDGRIEFEGRDLLTETDIEEAHARVALLAQKARLFTATVLENAIFMATPAHPISKLRKRELAEEILQPLGLWRRFESRLGERVTALSIAEQRMLGLARLVGGGARVILADEPLRDIAEAETSELLALFKRLAETCAVVVVTHHQGHARALADRILFVVGGRLVEQAGTDAFFERPDTEMGRDFLSSGSCWPKDLDEFKAYETPTDESGAKSMASEPESSPTVSTPVRSVRQSGPMPGGFHWILRGVLGGMQRPGLLVEEEDDLNALQRLGVTMLVTLTEEPYPAAKLAPFGVDAVHFPIRDMGVPSLADARDLCAQLAPRIKRGEPTILHCKAGLGRTGTMLACCLVFGGVEPLRAIHEVRQINPLYIQSQEQLEFISAFGPYVRESSSPS